MSTTPSGQATGALAAVDGLVHRLVRRERWLLVADVLGRALLLGFVVALLLVLGPTFRWGRSEVAALVVFVLGAGLWQVVIAPSLGRWSLAGDRLRQARLIEGAAPDLRGRLVTAVEANLRGTSAGQSDALLALVAQRAAAGAATVPPSRIHGGGRQALVLAAALFLLLLPLPLSFIAGGPSAVVAWWARGLDTAGSLVVVDPSAAADAAQVGDLVLTYTYPAYTGLEPRVVENSTGDVSAVRGTVVQVRARSADPVEAAGLVAYDERFEAQVEEGRTIAGQFSIGAESGTYHLVTWRGEVSQDSRDFAINAEQDLAPEVLLDTVTPVLELAVDEELALQWRARDDYGVQFADLNIDGKKALRLATTSERRAEIDGQEYTTPAELGLKPGDEVELTVVAWDNDTVSGTKMGISQPVTLVVLGARGLSDRIDEQRDQIIEAMLTVLADHLVDPWPPARSIAELARWGEAVSKRYAPLQTLVDAEWDRLPPDSLERGALEEAVRAGGDLVRFAAVTFDRDRKDAPASQDTDELKRLRELAVVTLEDGILMLDKTKRNQALGEAVEITENMADLAAEMERVLAQDKPDPLQMLAMLDELQRMMQDLAEKTAKLDEGGLKEFLNARQDQVGGLMEEIQKAIQEGRMDDARKLMERLANQLQQLSEGMKDTLERQQGEGNDAMQQAEQLKDELAALEQEQRDLQEKVQELREKEDQQTSAQQDALWKQIREESNATLLELASYRLGLETAGREFSEKQRAESARLDAERLGQAVERQDVRGSRFSLRNTQFGVDSMNRGFKVTRQLTSGRVQGPGSAELDSLMRHLDKIEQLLEQLEKQESSPQTSAQSQQLQQQQQELEKRLESAKQAAGEMMKDFPTNPRDMGEQLDQAGERMKEAGEDLGQGKPMQAQGSQGAAADRIKEARESLEKAMEQAQQQQQQQQGQGKSSGKEPGGEDKPGDKKGRGSDNDRPRVDIPGAEEFRTPEEYRKALLEGMEGEVPDEFEAMKKRYFEELVRQ